MPRNDNGAAHSTKASLPRPKKKTHGQLILEYLQEGGRLTFFQAVDLFRCRALAQRIGELRAQGHPIKSKMVETTNGAKIAEYWLEQPSGERST